MSGYYHRRRDYSSGLSRIIDHNSRIVDLNSSRRSSSRGSSTSLRDELYEQRQKHRRLQNEISDLKRRQRTERQREQRERNNRMKSYNVQISNLRQQNSRSQQQHTKEIQRIADENNFKIQNERRLRENDKILNEKKLKEMDEKTKESIKQIKQNELKKHFKHQKQLTETLMSAYENQKVNTKKIYKQYIDELTKIGLEERRLMKFKYERDNPKLLNVILVGITGHGKSMLACRLAGDETDTCNSGHFIFHEKMESCTQTISKKICTNKWKKDISIIDTPGIFDSNGKDNEHANNLVEFLRGCGGINAFILVKTRVPPRFDAAFQKVLHQLEQLLGHNFWRHVIIAITHTKGADARPESFDRYCKDFKRFIYSEMNLKEDEAPLNCIGIDSFKNYKKPLRKLIDLIPKHRFNCKRLTSPLQELREQNKMTSNQFKIHKKELDKMKIEILQTYQQLTTISNSSSIIKSGYLHKRSLHVNKKRKRWIVLTSNNLFSYKDASCNSGATETFDLSQCVASSVRANKNEFELVFGDHNLSHYHYKKSVKRTFIAKNNDSSIKWVKAIRCAIQKTSHSHVNDDEKEINEFVSQNVDVWFVQKVSAIESEAKDEWKIQIKLPPQEPQPKYNIINHINHASNNDEQKNNNSCRKPRAQKNNGSCKWVKNNAVYYDNKFIGELSDDQITLNLQYKDTFGQAEWTVKLDLNDENYDETVEIFEKAEEDGVDVRVDVIEYKWINISNKKQTKVERKVSLVVALN